MRPLRHLRRIRRIDAAAVGRLCALLAPAPAVEMGGGMAEAVAPRPKRTVRARRARPPARVPEAVVSAPVPPAMSVVAPMAPVTIVSPHPPEPYRAPPAPEPRRQPAPPHAYGDDDAFQRQLAAVAAGRGIVERIPFHDRRYDVGTLGGVVGEINL